MSVNHFWQIIDKNKSVSTSFLVLKYVFLEHDIINKLDEENIETLSIVRHLLC